jgi:hypothetical protein
MATLVTLRWSGSGSGYSLSLDGATLCSRPYGKLGEATPSGHALVALLDGLGIARIVSESVRGFGYVKIVAELDYDQVKLFRGLYDTGVAL